MFAPGALGAGLATASSLRDVYEALRAWPMIGAFMGYQLAIDLNYSDHLDFDENDFTVPGPGAVRGIEKVFTDIAGRSPPQLIMEWWSARTSNSLVSASNGPVCSGGR